MTFGIGDPDIPTPAHIMDALHRAADEPANHRYPESEGLPELRQRHLRLLQAPLRSFASTRRRKRSRSSARKKASAHIALCFIDPGDVALVPDPGYPVYEVGHDVRWRRAVQAAPARAKAACCPTSTPSPRTSREGARLIWLNYPNNPTGAVADIGVLRDARSPGREAVRRRDLHDNPYSDVAYDGYKPVSIFSGSRARGTSASSSTRWSKVYNMTGWRIGMAVG